MRYFILILACLTGSAATAEPAQYIVSDAMKAANLPFSQAVRVGDVLYLSGELGVDESFDLVEGGIEPETHQLFANIKKTLTENGSSLEDVFKCTVMLDNIDEWPAFNKIYVTYFPGNKPARSAFGAEGLALGAAVEMECWATVE